MTRSAGNVTSCTQTGRSRVTATYMLTMGDGTRYFGKVLVPGAPSLLLTEESASLRALAETQTVRVPEIVGEGPGWLLLEWLEASARDTGNTWRSLGESLAALHRIRYATYGWPRSNFIGALPQSNLPCSDWPAFWRDERLVPLARGARDTGLIDVSLSKRIDRVCDELDATLGASAVMEGASLLHGDLWSGNVVLTGSSGAVFDPSCYYGHREVDLAMAALFGGFNREFYSAYGSAYPLLPGWERRRAIYQLYYVLAHVIMFGGSYIRMASEVAGAAGY